MHISRPRLTRRAWLLLGVLSLATTYACADRVASPRPSTPRLDLEASGVYVSTLWRPTDSGATYLGGITGRAGFPEAAVSLGGATGGVRPLSAPVPSAPLADRATAAPQHRLVPTRTVLVKTKEGKQVRLQFADDPRRDGRPPMAVIVFDGGRPFAVNEYSYARDVKGWRVVHTRTTLLDEHGKAKLIVDRDAGGVTSRQASSVAALGSAESHADRALAGGTHVARPDVVSTPNTAAYDYTDDADGTRCLAEKLAVASATAKWIAAAAALAAVTIAVCTAAPEVCTAAIVAAQATLAEADIALGEAVGNLYNCMNPPPPPPPPPTTGEGGGGGDAPGTNYQEWCEFENTYVDGQLVDSRVIQCWWVAA